MVFVACFKLNSLLPLSVQVILNFKRCSVVGLNFDFLILNITGYLCYSAFNLSLILSPVIQDQYFAIHRGGVNPVQINDVVFAVHGLALSSFTGFQALILKVRSNVIEVCFVHMILYCNDWLGWHV